MGLGSTAKKLQKVANMAEDLYKRMNELVSQMKALQSDVEETTEQVDDLERQVTEQRAIIEALAAEQGIDVDAILADLDDGDGEAGDESGASEEGKATDEGEATDESDGDAATAESDAPESSAG